MVALVMPWIGVNWGVVRDAYVCGALETLVTSDGTDGEVPHD